MSEHTNAADCEGEVLGGALVNGRGRYDEDYGGGVYGNGGNREN